MDYITKYKVNELTPVEQHGDFFFKRDDLYKPFINNFPYLNGGKCRQGICLIGENQDCITKAYNCIISTYTSVLSPQSLIIALVAKEFGFKSIIGIGNSTVEKAVKHPTIRYAKELGAEIKILCKTQAFNNVLLSRLYKLAKKQPMFIVNFGINITSNKKAIVDSISNQVQNLPNDLDTLVIPAGSGITSGGILRGIYKFKKNIKNIYIVQPFGHDRTPTIQECISDLSENEEFFNISKKLNNYKYICCKYPYHKLLKVKVNNDLELDSRYESKSYDYSIKNKLLDKNKKCCFWIVGNQNWLYD